MIKEMIRPHRALLACVVLAAFGHGAAATEWVAVLVDAQGTPVKDALVMLRNGTVAVPSAATTQVAQRGAEFDPGTAVITLGTPVNFPNFDRARHHVYSFSPAKTFQIELYKGTPSEAVVFDQPGIVTIGCNVHDWMYGVLYVVDTPFHMISNEQGQVSIDAPPGDYTALVWHPQLATAIELPVSLGAAQVAPTRIAANMRPAPLRPQRPQPPAPRKR